MIIRITKKAFLEWYFEGGWDQENEDMLMDFGELVYNKLYNSENNLTSISVQEILDECNTGIIPYNITENCIDIEDDRTLDELESEYEIELI